MSVISEATIEEFEGGAWVAEIISTASFDGSFSMGGETWTGTSIGERFDKERYHTRVVGGAGKLAAMLQDKYYAGSVSLSVAIQDICREGGETFGAATPGLFLNTWQRIKGTVAQSLDSLALAFSLIWWIDRSGKVNMQAARNTGPDATGTRVSADTDTSIILAEPTGVQLGAGYNSADPVAKMALIRHVRWDYRPARISAHLYAVPFIFRSPVQTAYDRTYDARVDKDNGDGTIDLIADGRFGVTRVPLLCGVPGSKVQVRGGEQVTLGFFGGDPQKPFAVAMAQNTAATKKVARSTDPVKVTIPAGSFLVSCSGSPAVGVLNPSPIDVTGTIQNGTARIAVGD